MIERIITVIDTIATTRAQEELSGYLKQKRKELDNDFQSLLQRCSFVRNQHFNLIFKPVPWTALMQEQNKVGRKDWAKAHAGPWS